MDLLQFVDGKYTYFPDFASANKAARNNLELTFMRMSVFIFSGEMSTSVIEGSYDKCILTLKNL